jgi:hypothetical protein
MTVYHLHLRCALAQVQVLPGTPLHRADGCPTPLRFGDFPVPKLAGLRLRSLSEEPGPLFSDRYWVLGGLLFHPIEVCRRGQGLHGTRMKADVSMRQQVARRKASAAWWPRRWSAPVFPNLSLELAHCEGLAHAKKKP